MKPCTKKIMVLSLCCSISTVVISARGAAAKVVQTRECLDEDTFIPLCTNGSGHASCHYGNIGNTLRWQQNALKEGLANYAEGDSHKLLRVACYLAAYVLLGRLCAKTRARRVWLCGSHQCLLRNVMAPEECITRM